MKSYRSLILLCVFILTLLTSVSSCTPQPRAILGQIQYSGLHRGDISVVAVRPNEVGITSSYTIGLTRLGPYDIRVRTGTYTVSAYMDVNYNNRQDADEPSGIYDANGDNMPDEIIVKGEVTDIDIILLDP